MAHLQNPSLGSQRGKRPFSSNSRKVSNKKQKLLEHLAALKYEISLESEDDDEFQVDEELQDRDDFDHDQLAAISNKPASKPGKFGTPYLDGKYVRSFASPRRRRLPPPAQAPRQAVTTNTASSPAQNPLHTATTTNTEAPQPGETPVTTPLPEPTAQISQIRQALRQRRICFFYAFGMKRPYGTCHFNHGQRGLQFGW